MAKKEKKSGKKKLLIVLSAILVIAIVASTVVFVKYKDLVTPPDEIVQDTNVYDFDEDETVPETLASDPIFDTIYEETAGSYKEAVKTWATNGGEVMYSNHVINILCCGVDTRNPNAIAGLTDTILIMSINTELKTLTLTSIMRDSFAYIANPDGNGGTFNKINAAFPFYGVDGLIPAIENNFKIRIDGYALINFSLFKAAIDKLGGVTVPVQQYEANYMNNNYKNCSIEAGDAVTLTGDEALAFCRSRKCDSDGDVSRTRRQRQVIQAVLSKCKDIKLSELDDYVKTFLPYLQTSYTTKDVLELGTKAITEEWATYEFKQVLAPSEEAIKGVSGSSMWYWAVDYPLAAQTLQLAIYDKTNIELAEDRVTAIQLLTRYGER
ncbi:MAG: LCP family protein [Clostridia bacterium]|nr:LCP family protein [Clostridia bacterium]